MPDGPTTTVAGRIVHWQRKITKRGRTWVSGRLDTAGAEVDFEIFPDAYEEIGGSMWEGDLVRLAGRVDHRLGYPVLNVTRLADCPLTHTQHALAWRSWRDDCVGPGGCGYAQQDVEQCERGHPDDGVTDCGACGHGAAGVAS
jgi:hypothetical protein